MRLVVHVGRVVFEGVPLTAAECDRLRSTLADELATQLGGRPLTHDLAGGTALHRMVAPAVTLAPGHLAAPIARSVATGLAGPPPLGTGR